MKSLTTNLNTMTHINFAVLIILIATGVPYSSVMFALCALLIHQTFLACMALWNPVTTYKNVRKFSTNLRKPKTTTPEATTND